MGTGLVWYLAGIVLFATSMPLALRSGAVTIGQASCPPGNTPPIPGTRSPAVASTASRMSPLICFPILSTFSHVKLVLGWSRGLWLEKCGRGEVTHGPASSLLLCSVLSRLLRLVLPVTAVTGCTCHYSFHHTISLSATAPRSQARSAPAPRQAARSRWRMQRQIQCQRPR